MHIYKSKTVIFIFYFLVAALGLSGMAYLEWPGITNADFEADYYKAQIDKVNYWRSYLYSLYMALGHFFDFKRPGYLVLQLMSIGFIFATLFTKLHPLAPRYALITAIAILIWPINQLFSVFLIRDVLSSWLCVLAAIELFTLLISNRRPYFFLILNAVLIFIRPENIIMSLIGFLIILCKRRTAFKKIIFAQCIAITFLSYILPLMIGVDPSRIKPFARGAEKYTYETVSLLSPIKENLKAMSLDELSHVNWPALETILPKEKWLNDSHPILAHTLHLPNKHTESDWSQFNTEAYKIIYAHPLLFIKNRIEMARHALGFGPFTYYLHSDKNINVFSSILLYLPKWFFASLLIPFALSLFCFLNYRKYPICVLVLFYSWSRLVPIFVMQPAPHFSYSYSIFLIGFFVILLMRIEALYWKLSG